MSDLKLLLTFEFSGDINCSEQHALEHETSVEISALDGKIAGEKPAKSFEAGFDSDDGIVPDNDDVSLYQFRLLKGS